MGKHLFNGIYNGALALIALLAFPKLLYQRMVYKKHRGTFWQRWGLRLPAVTKDDRPWVWIHAVSMGEVKAVASLAKLLKESFPHIRLVVSSVTATGYETIEQCLPMADYRLYFPFDFSFVARRVVSHFHPTLVVLSEGDLWFQFLQAAKQEGAIIALVNGKMSQRSLHRYRWAPWFSHRLFGLIDIYCVQNECYRERFVAVGVPNEKISVTGNLKLDAEYPILSAETAAQWRTRLGIEPGDQVLIIGSTHDLEEKAFINLLKGLWRKLPTLKVMLVPRHPERFDEVAALLEQEGVPLLRWSQPQKRQGNERLVLVDTVGVLRQCYQLADVAIVAGSYTDKVGGHNIIEPCGYEVPVIFGPYMHSQQELVDLVLTYQAGLSVPLDQLEQVLLTLFSDPVARRRLGDGGRRLIGSFAGATKKTLDEITESLDPLHARREGVEVCCRPRG